MCWQCSNALHLSSLFLSLTLDVWILVLHPWKQNRDEQGWRRWSGFGSEVSEGWTFHGPGGSLRWMFNWTIETSSKLEICVQFVAGNFFLRQENYHYFEYPCFSFILNQGLKAKTIRVFCLKIILQSCQCFHFKHFSCKLKFWGKEIESIHWYSHPDSALIWDWKCSRHDLFQHKGTFWQKENFEELFLK